MGYLLTIFILLVGLTGNAATYYVDYSAGSDANAGTSTGAAWQRCPGDSEYTGSGSLVSGDVVFFKGGVAYAFTDSDTVGITLTSGVTYDGNSAGTWGTGKATVTDNNTNPGHSGFYAATAVSNIVIKNFTVTQLGGSSSLPTDTGSAVSPNNGWGVNCSGGANNFTVADSDFSACGYWYNQKPMNANSIDGQCITFFPSGSYLNANITITNCDFTKASQGVNLCAGSYLTNCAILECNFHDYINWSVDINMRTTGTYVDGITIRGCKFYNYYQFNQDYWTGYDGNTTNTGGWPHTDGIFFRVDYTGTTFGTNINFYNNMFYCQTNTGGGTAPIYITEGPSCNIYNNIFMSSAMQNGNIVVGDGPLDGSNNQLVRVFNNTFYDSYAFDLTINNANSLNNPIGRVQCFNNIFYDAMTGSGNNFVIQFNTGNISWNWHTNWFVDNNLYLSFNTGGTYALSSQTWGEGNITNMQTQGWETNGVALNPQFTDISYGLSNPNVLSNNLTVQSGSPAIGAGTNLTSLATYLPGLNKDYAGNDRPTTGGWTIGAYEFTSGGGGGGGGGGFSGQTVGTQFGP